MAKYWKTERVEGNHRALEKWLNEPTDNPDYSVSKIVFSGSVEKPAYTVIFVRMPDDYLRQRRAALRASHQKTTNRRRQ